MTVRPRPRRFGAASLTAFGVALFLFSRATLSAHAVSTTTVSVVVDRAGAYAVTITADADPLIAKLEALSNAPLTATTAKTTAERSARLDALRPVLVERVELDFDGVRVVPTAEPSVVSDAGQATMRLVGPIPTHARTLIWSSSLVYGSYPLAVRRADDQEVVRWLQGQDKSEPIALEGANQARAIGRGIWLGFTHILPNGFDHILFVIGLFLLSTRPRQLFAQVSAFTLAHSITLGLSLYGVFSLPGRIVEPMIALSVAYVGVENLMTRQLQPWRVFVVFGFGLVHGLGFAEALASLHLSRPEMMSTLVSFNVGVEGGQLTVIAIAAIAIRMATIARRDWRQPIAAMVSAGIGVTGLLWTIQRVI